MTMPNTDRIQFANNRIKEIITEYDHLEEGGDAWKLFKHDTDSGVIREMHRYAGGSDFDVYRLLVYLWSGCCFDPMLTVQGLNAKILEEGTVEEIFFEHLNEKIDYDDIISNCKIHRVKQDCKYNIIVPVRNRDEHLITFLANACHVLDKKDDWCITMIMQEEGKEHVFDNIRKYFPVNLIYLPHEYFKQEYGDVMNKSLCYNVASKLVKCEWQICHDVDCIFYSNFIENIETRTQQEDLPWLQPFRGSRVIYLDEETSGEIIKNTSEQKEYTIKCGIPDLNNTPHEPGAPGGSIVVRQKDYFEVGGFPAELCWGYAPEDLIFWRKLEYLYSEDLSIFGIDNDATYQTHPFIRDDVFSHDSDVELFHLWHPLGKCETRFPFWLLYLGNYITNCLEEKEIKLWLKKSKENLS